MPLVSFEGRHPQVDPQAWVAETATLIGDVTVEANASVWYGAVLRADCGPIVVEAGANVQDNAVIHGPPDVTVRIGAGATIGHLCQIHGSDIGAGALIGNGSTVLDGVRIGAGALVAAHALVTPGTQIEDGMLAAGVPAKPIKAIAGGPLAEVVAINGRYYEELARRHRDGAETVG